jgi:hypothetical protein
MAIVILTSLVLFSFLVLGFELRAYISSHYISPIFVVGVSEIESRELFP